jgi:DNA polymerase-4
VSRCIAHLDLDAFYASVELQRRPELRGLPVIVAGGGPRAVVTTASYEARRFGIGSAMPASRARRLCPEAVVIPPDFGAYREVSGTVMRIVREQIERVEVVGLDEAYADLSGLVAPHAAMRRLVADVREGTGLSVSIGIGPNKLVAKMAAGVQKPRGLTALDEEGFRSVFWPCQVQSMWGVGPQLAARMRSLGITTVGELAHAPDYALQAAFGIIGPQLRDAAWGRDDTPLTPYHQGVKAKPMGHEVTLSEDCDDPTFLEGTLLRLSDQVARRLRSEGYVGRTVCVKLRDHRFSTIMRQRALPGFTADHRQVFEAARGLWREHWRGGPLRLVGVTVSSLERAIPAGQTELFEPELRATRLREALDRVRDRLGESSLVPAGSLTHRRRLGHVPFGPVSGRGKGGPS